MIAWIARKTGLSALVVKLILCAAAIGGILYGLWLWGNAQWYKGETHGRQVVAKEIVKQKQAEWKAKEDAIALDAAAIAAERRAVRASSEQLSRDRASLSRSLKDGLERVATERRAYYENVVSIPDPMLDAAIRAISRELANAQP